MKRKKKDTPPEDDLYAKMVKRSKSEQQRKTLINERHYQEFGRTHGLREQEEEEEINLMVEKQQRRRSMIIVLQELINTKSPLLVITSAIADAETDYENVLHREEAKRITLPEPKKKLWPYQEEAVLFLGQRERDTANVGCRGLMLCDDMGLGKTLESLTYIYRHIQQRQQETGRRFNGVTLIVLPSNIIYTWTKEIETSFPPNSLRYVKMMGDKVNVPDRLHIESCTDIIFTTYTVLSLVYKALFMNEEGDETTEYEEKMVDSETADYIRHRYQMLYDITFVRVVPDEAHYMVNRNTTRFKAMRKLKARSKWMNTGTPIQNSYANIYACFEFIGVKMEGIFANVVTESSIVTKSDEEYMKNILDKVMLRRLKHQIEWGIETPFFLNKVDKQVIFIDFDTHAERILYLMYAEYGLTKMSNTKKGGGGRCSLNLLDTEKNINITSIIQLMRQCCIDFHIVRKHIIPNGMLLGSNASTLQVKRTSFGEKLFHQDSCHYEHLDRDNSELERRAFSLNKRTTYRYKSSDSKTKRKYVWDPYGGDNGGDDELSCQLYQFVYELIRDDRHSDVENIIEEVSSVMGPLDTETETRLRRIYSHLEARILPQYSTKLRRAVHYIVNEIEDRTDKVIIFSDSVTFLRQASQCLSAHGIKSCIITGENTKDSECETQLHRFNTDPSITVLLISLKKGCVGLNIPIANHILFFSLWWNPYSELQAECRSQRVGQKKQVRIRYFILQDTMEEYILSLSTYKKNISYQLIENHDDTTDAINATVDEATRSRLFGFKLLLSQT